MYYLLFIFDSNYKREMIYCPKRHKELEINDICWTVIFSFSAQDLFSMAYLASYQCYMAFRFGQESGHAYCPKWPFTVQKGRYLINSSYIKIHRY